MPRLGKGEESRTITDVAPVGVSDDPWAVVAELRTLAALTADISQAMSGSSSLRQCLQISAEALFHSLDAAFARIWVLNEKENVLELQASAGLYTHLDGPHSRVPVGQLKIGMIALERKPHLTNAVIGDPLVSDQEWARREGIIAFAGHPLICVNDQIVGVMAMFSRHQLTTTTLHSLETVADSIANGIAHWRTLEALRASEERFFLAIQGTGEGIWDWNVLTNEAYHSSRFKELLGYEEHELKDQFDEFESRLHPEDLDQVRLALRQHLEQRVPFEVEYRLLTKSGRYRWFHARGQAVWTANGRAVRMLGSIADINARILAEERLAAVHEVTRILAETSDLSKSLPKILQVLCEGLNWRIGEFWQRDMKNDVLRLAAFSQLASAPSPVFEAASRRLSFQRGVGLPGRTWASKRPEWIENVIRDANFPRSEVAAQENIYCAMAFPILVRGEVYGVMEFFNGYSQEWDHGLLEALGDIALQISRSVELQQEHELIRRHQQELAIAQKIQQKTVPNVMPVMKGFEIAGASVPAAQTGGDYFDFIPLSSDHLLLAVGDVSGHGLGPALVVAGARAYVRILAAMESTIERMISLVNQRLAEDTNEEFMTLFLGVINPSNRSLIYYNAGHCPGIIMDASGEVRTRLAPYDKPLGIDLDQKYQQSAVAKFLPGDLLFVHSDGVFEACAPDGTAFGMARVLETIRTSRHLSPAVIIGKLFDTVREFSKTALDDDMTAIVIKVAEAM
jgi:PAS domain S-box-containing protein